MKNDITITGRRIDISKHASGVSMSKRTPRRYQLRLSILGCFALLHAVRSAKPQNPSRLCRD